MLRRLKTYLGSTMRQDRLSSLALLHINYTMVIDVDEVIDMFAHKHPRRMILIGRHYRLTLIECHNRFNKANRYIDGH